MFNQHFFGLTYFPTNFFPKIGFTPVFTFGKALNGLLGLSGQECN